MLIIRNIKIYFIKEPITPPSNYLEDFSNYIQNSKQIEIIDEPSE